MTYKPQLPPVLLEKGVTPEDHVGSPTFEKPVTPVTAVTPVLNKDLVNPDVAWRVDAMRPQIPSEGTIPFLVAQEVPWRKGQCLSCGDPLPEGRKCRCLPCSRAAHLVIEEIRT